MKKKQIVLLFVLAALIALVACGKASDSMQTNIFEYVVDTSNNSLLPKQIDYLMSVEEVLDARDLNEDVARKVDADREHMQIASTLEIKGFSHEVVETLMFQEDKALWKVGYYIKVDASEYKVICAELYEQAKEIMPASIGKMEEMKEGGNVLWQDTEGNTVGFSVANTNEEGKKAICIEMSVSKTQLKEFFDTK